MNDRCVFGSTFPRSPLEVKMNVRVVLLELT